MVRSPPPPGGVPAGRVLQCLSPPAGPNRGHARPSRRMRSMADLDTDRNLLFGVLALQADLIDARQFARGCALWAADKARPLAEILVEQRWLTPGDRTDV